MRVVKLIAINAIVFFAIILVIELFGQLVYLLKNGSFLLLQETHSSAVFEPHPFLVGRPKSSIAISLAEGTITTTAENTRWTGAVQSDDNLIRVALLGGSTVFGNGVSDEDTWPALLQEILGEGYAVTNYGVPGYTTAENIIQMALIVPAKRPHIVIFYEGWNDIKNYHEKGLGADYYKHGLLQYRALGTANLTRLSRDPEETFAIAKLAFRISRLIVGRQSGSDSTYQLFDNPDPFVDEIYLRNLHTLRILSEQIGAFGVFVPQVMNDIAYVRSKTNSGWSRNIRDAEFPALMAKFNSHMTELCDQHESDCVVLMSPLQEEWRPDDFVDRGHLSRNGGMKLAAIIAEFIRDRPEISVPAY